MGVSSAGQVDSLHVNKQRPRLDILLDGYDRSRSRLWEDSIQSDLLQTLAGISFAVLGKIEQILRAPSGSDLLRSSCPRSRV